jgi:hypothetical protein
MLDDFLRELDRLFFGQSHPPRPAGRSGPSPWSTMNGYNFTERVRKVLAMAREEAARLQHGYVGTEHLLLGLILEGEGVAAAVLANLSVDLEELRQNVEASVKKGKEAPIRGPDLPYTTRAKKVLELAMSEARELNHSYVGTEHLLLGLFREEKGIAARALTDTGVNLDAARAETLRLLGTEIRSRSGRQRAESGTADAAHSPATVRRRPRRSIGLPLARGDSAARRELNHALILERIAGTRRTQAEADRLEEETAWLRVRGIIEVCERLGTPIRLEAAADSGLTLVIADRLRIDIPGTRSPAADDAGGSGGLGTAD